MKIRNSIFPALFIVFVLAVSVSLGVRTYKDLGARGAAKELVESIRDVDADSWETAVNDRLDSDHIFINIFGSIQRAIGKRFVEDAAGNPVVRLGNGQLTFAGVTENVDQTENAENVIRLKNELAGSGIPVMAVIAPTKLSNPAARMPKGVEDYGNAMGDEFLAKLEGKTDTLDLRPDFLAADPDNSWFFNTDHHWRPEGALFACGTLMGELAEKYGFDVNDEALDPESYDKTVYEDIFLGSQGKRVGQYYAGVDDFTVFTPRFDTRFEYTYTGAAEPRRGSFSDALCFEERLVKDYFGGNPYAYYSGGDWGRSEIVNLNYPEGPTVVLIRDSFACALTPFLAIQCGKLITMDMRAYEGDLTAEIEELGADAVLVLYTASTLKDPDMVDFFGENE